VIVMTCIVTGRFGRTCCDSVTKLAYSGTVRNAIRTQGTRYELAASLSGRRPAPKVLKRRFPALPYSPESP